MLETRRKWLSLDSLLKMDESYLIVIITENGQSKKEDKNIIVNKCEVYYPN